MTYFMYYINTLLKSSNLLWLAGGLYAAVDDFIYGYDDLPLILLEYCGYLQNQIQTMWLTEQFTLSNKNIVSQ